MALSNILQSRRIPDFFRRAALSMSLRFTGVLLQFIGSIIAARILGPAGYGAFAYAFVVATMIGVALSLGMVDLTVREVPRFILANEIGSAIGFVGLGLAVIGVFGALSGVILYYLEAADIFVFGTGWLLVAAMAVIHATILLLSNVLNSFQRVITAQVIESILRQLIYLGLIAFILVGGFVFTPTLLFLAAVLAGARAITLMIVRILPLMIRDRNDSERIAVRGRTWLIAAFPLFATSLFNYLQLDIDVIMVGALLSDYDVGLYRVAARAAMLVMIAVWVSLQLSGPLISRALKDSSEDEVQKLIRNSSIVIFGSGIAIIAVLGLGTRPYLGLFGPEFVEAARSMRLLLMAQLAIVLAGPAALLLTMMHRERLVLWASIAGLILNFTLNYILINRMGMDGAAIASLISIGLTQGFLVAVIMRTTPYNTTVLGWRF